MKKYHIVLACLLLSSLASCTKHVPPSCSSCTSSEYKVEFRNLDDTILYETQVSYNESAIYLGEKPVRQASEGSSFFYDFKGWNQNLSHIQEDIIVYPMFHMIDLNELNEGDYTYRKMYEIQDNKLTTIGYELYKYNDLEYKGTVTAPTKYRNLPILRVGEACFMDCDMEEIILPETIEVIDNYAFNSSENLLRVNIPNATYVLGYAAFYITRSIRSINLNQIGYIGVDNFHLCDSLSEFEVAENNHQFTTENGLLYTKNYEILIKAAEAITSFQLSKKTQQILPEGLSRLQKIKEIILPENITSLAEMLFFEAKVEKVTFLGEVKEIPRATFRYCNQLREIILPEGLETIHDYAFYHCERLTNLSLPDSVISIGDFSFAYCYAITSFPISLSLEHIGYGALDELTHLSSFQIDEKQRHFSVYDDCLYTKNLETLIRVPEKKGLMNFANNVKVIGSGAFYKCQEIQSLTLPETLIKIEDFAFYFMNQVYTLQIPSSVQEIGESAFDTMEHLVSITLPNLKTLSKNLFSNCEILQEISIPSSVTSLEEGVFYNCGLLESLIISENVSVIGKDCFTGCNSLDTIYYTGTEQQWKNIVGLPYCGLTDITNIVYQYQMG